MNSNSFRSPWAEFTQVSDVVLRHQTYYLVTWLTVYRAPQVLRTSEKLRGEIVVKECCQTLYLYDFSLTVNC